jgi:hypothetical protein
MHTVRKKKKHFHRHQTHSRGKFLSKLLNNINNNKNKTDNEMNSDDSFYNGYKPKVKISEDKQKAGPSSDRLKNTLKEEVSTNLRYSWPSSYDHSRFTQ